MLFHIDFKFFTSSYFTVALVQIADKISVIFLFGARNPQPIGF